MFRSSLSAYSILLLAITQSTIGYTVRKEIDLDTTLYLDDDPLSVPVSFSMPYQINAVAVFTDWWKKRPTKITVYKINPDGSEEMAGQWESYRYSGMICGDWDNLAVQCSYPDHPIARLFVSLQEPGSSKDWRVEIAGLLDEDQEYAILDTLQMLF